MAAYPTAALSGCPVIIGGGVAGLTTALTMRRPCVVVSHGSLAFSTSSYLAQGGVAGAVGHGDTIAQHVMDTIAAGAGLCDENAVNVILSETGETIEALTRWGVTFARTAGGAFDLHQEAAHRAARILHADGDGTGRAIMDVLARVVLARDDVTVIDNVSLREIAVEAGRVIGVWLSDGRYLPTSQCVLASGGIAGHYPVSTNPSTNTGIPIALALRVGAIVMDLEFIQFHPTGFAVGHEGGRCLLISEAVRGAGARLVDGKGREFTDPLAPRDVVARAVASQARTGHGAYLDARGLFRDGFAQHFPVIAQGCRLRGIDPDHDLIPVSPAAHYTMGGIKTDLAGQTSVEGLWACGEVAATGLHGANRLASNSLLEACVMGRRVGRALRGMFLPATRLGEPSRHHQNATARSYRALMGEALGLMRDGPALARAFDVFSRDMAHDDHALLGAVMAHAAQQRRESRGSHWRSDAPGSAKPRHSLTGLNDLQFNIT